MVNLHLPHRKSHGKELKEPVPAHVNGRRPSPSRHATASSMLADSKQLTLRINVIKARNLAPKDKSGTSDPYLVVSLGTSRQSTPSVSKTLNPEWNTSFDMPLGEVPLVECTCWDKDRFSKDYMGEFDIAVEDIFADGRLQQEVMITTLDRTHANSVPAAEMV